MGSAPFAHWPQGQLSCELSPPPPSSASVSPNAELASHAQPSRHPLGTLPGVGDGRSSDQKLQEAGPATASTLRTRQQQGRPRGRRSRGHRLPLLPHLPAEASPAGVKLIRRASGERVRPPSPRASSHPPGLPQPWPGLTDLCFLSPHQPSAPHMALASTAK